MRKKDNCIKEKSTSNNEHVKKIQYEGEIQPYNLNRLYLLMRKKDNCIKEKSTSNNKHVKKIQYEGEIQPYNLNRLYLLMCKKIAKK